MTPEELAALEGRIADGSDLRLPHDLAARLLADVRRALQVADLLAAFTPHVAAARSAGFRAGVEAAAKLCDAEVAFARGSKSALDIHGSLVASRTASAIRALPVPVEFAAVSGAGATIGRGCE